MEKNRALDRYFLAATGKATPRICFVGTASGDAESYRYKFYEAMSALDCRATHLSLIQPPSADLGAFVFAQDVIFVGGGNTRSLLALWREWGLDAILREAYERGIVLARGRRRGRIGSNAGTSTCWRRRYHLICSIELRPRAVLSQSAPKRTFSDPIGAKRTFRR